MLGKSKPVLTYQAKKHFMSYNSPAALFTLMKYGIVIYGREISELNLHTSEVELIRYVSENAKTFWANNISGSEKLFSKKGVLSLTGLGIEMYVCGLSRVYYTLHEKDVTSKSNAVKYAMNVVPKQFHFILQEALLLRANKRFFYSKFNKYIFILQEALSLLTNNKNRYHQRFKKRKEMLDYAKYVMNLFKLK